MGLNKRLISSEAAAAFTNTDNFAPVTYTGNGSTQSITSLDFQPDLVWIKNRSVAREHILCDSVRGVNKELSSDVTDAEESRGVTSFDSNGFSLDGLTPNYNGNNEQYVAWCWKAGGTAVSNTDGSITSQVSANTAAGFSIVSYTGTGSNTNFGHGLDSSPELTIIKNRDDGTRDWIVHPSSQGTDKYLILNGSNAINTSSIRIQSVNSTVVNIGTNTEVNANGQDFICYNFHSVDGYQKIGSYTGDGTTSNSITTGFEPRFLMIKITSGVDNWVIFDNARDTSNPRNTNLKPNSSAAETDESGSQVNFTSTGFTCIGSGAGLGQVNSSGASYIYLAIA